MNKFDILKLLQDDLIYKIDNLQDEILVLKNKVNAIQNMLIEERGVEK